MTGYCLPEDRPSCHPDNRQGGGISGLNGVERPLKARSLRRFAPFGTTGMASLVREDNTGRVFDSE